VIRIDWKHPDAGALLAIEPTDAEITQHSLALSTGYNEPTNAELMGHANAISPSEVIDAYTESIAGGMRAFLLFVDGAFAGDADLRNFRGNTAEFAFMIAAPTAQGKGLGTAFATMIHAFGFRTLDLHRIYASVVPHNTASQRVFEKLGYVVDETRAGREYAEEPGDIVLVLERAAFQVPPGIVIGAR
jgi:RimJ/RimL family protein N-acetyltransferase